MTDPRFERALEQYLEAQRLSRRRFLGRADGHHLGVRPTRRPRGAAADDAYSFLHRGAEHMPATATFDCRRRDLEMAMNGNGKPLAGREVVIVEAARTPVGDKTALRTMSATFFHCGRAHGKSPRTSIFI